MELGRHRLQDRAKRRKWYEGADPVVFCAFDLLVRDGRSLIGLPIEGRKQQLQELLSPLPTSTTYVGHFESELGPELFAKAQTLKLEGLVAKREGSIYLPGERSKDWIKCKVPGSVPAERFKR